MATLTRLGIRSEGVSALTERPEKPFVYVVRRKEDRHFLLAFESHDEPGWEVPKGAVEQGESPVGAAYRELHEEAGLERASLSQASVLGASDYRDETQWFFLMMFQGDAPWEFCHRVTGIGLDAGFVYRFRWLPVSASLPALLVQGAGTFAGKLVARFATTGASGSRRLA